MRTSLAIACLAGVALASKSKNQRNKHTAAENPLERCSATARQFLRKGEVCDDIWRAWDSYCSASMTDIFIKIDCMQVTEYFWPSFAPAPPVACDDAQYFVPTGWNQDCIDLWLAYNIWCGSRWAIHQACHDVWNAAASRWSPAMPVMRKTQMQEKHSIKERKRAGKKQLQTVVDTAPAAGGTTIAGGAVRPAGDCLNWDAREYKSDTACDDIWRVWDQFCMNVKTDECVQVRKDMQEVTRQAPPPTFSYLLDWRQEWCNRAGDAYLDWCDEGASTPTKKEDYDAGEAIMWEGEDQWMEESQNTDAVMRKTTMQRKHELKKSAAGKHALERTAAKERSGKKASVNLAASSSAANDSQYASGVAMGAAVGAAAALGALYAISKCNKGRVDDFQRV